VGYTCIMCRLRALLFFIFLVFAGGSLFSQVKNEAELKKEAAKAFEEEEYATGFKLYSTLLANYPKDPEYNYRLGVCALFSEPDKKKAIAFLQAALKKEKEVEKEVLFYMGKAYHFNYQFDEAIKYYTQYKQVGSSSMQKKLLVDREIQCCKNGKRLLSNVKELVILDKKQLNQSDYFRSYDLKDIRGKLLAKPSDFTSANDKKKKDQSIIYLPASKDQLYYASYGSTDNKDIFIVRRLPNGNWSKPENLPGGVNTEFDEDYPFLHPNGNVLYFASKGHNSMGGFDVFKSEFDEGTRKWGAPVNLDFPINSPNDDYLFVTDSLEKIAFLASTRQSPAGKTDVYRILTERRPAEYAYISGKVLKKTQTQSLQARIKVKNIDTGEDAGTFSADANGEYNIKISNGGKYIFTVETPEMPTQSEGVNIPTAYSYKPYRQTIEYDNQKLVLTNFFNTSETDENNYSQYLALIEEKSKMSVNAADFDINPDNPVIKTNTAATNTATTASTNTTATTNTTVTTNTTTVATNTTSANVSNKQLVEMAYTDAKEMQQEANDLKKDASSAFSAANSKQDQANETKQELQDVQNKINSEADPAKKQELLSQADKLKQEADLYDKQAKTANTIAQQLEVDANNKQKEANLNMQYAKALEDADKTKNNKDAIAKLEDLQKQLEDLSKQKSQSNSLVEAIKADAQNKEQELTNAEKKQDKLTKDENEIKTQIADLDKQIEKTKDKGLLENLNAQKDELKTDLADKQKESQLNQTKIATLKDESDALKSQAEYASNIAEGKTPETNTVTSTNTNTVVAATTNTVTSVNTNTVAAVNTVSAVNTNTVAATNTNTVATTNTVSTNTTTTSQPNVFEEKSKQFDENIVALNSAGNTLENNKKKSEVLNEYVKAMDTELKDKKQQLAKAKTTEEKARLNTEVKELTDKKTGLQNEVKLVNNQVKEQEKQAALALNDAKKDSANKANASTVASTSTIKDTTEVKIVSDNDDPRLQNINTLLGSQNNFGEEKKIFGNLEYTDPKAVALKKQADDKLNELYKNNAALQMQLEQLKITVAKENAGNNDKKIQELSKQGEDLSLQAIQLRKDAKNMSGADKQNALNKILDLEKKAAGFKYQAAKLQYQSDDDNYEINKQALTQLTTQADQQKPEVQQSLVLIEQSEKTKKEASRQREEAEAQKETEAKIGALSNADEKEKEALKKQDEALALLMKDSPAVVTAKSSKEKQIEEIKGKLGNATQSSINALKLLYEANKAEYTALLNDINATEKRSGSKPEEIALKDEAQGAYKQAGGDYAKLNALKEDQQKRELLLSVNGKMEESINQLRKAKQLLSGEPIVSNTANTNTVAATNTVAVNNNTTASSTVATNNNTATTNTVAAVNTGSLSTQQAQEIKSTPEYKQYTALQNDVIKYNNAAIKDESAAKENKKKYEQLNQEIAGMPEGDTKNQKQKEADVLKERSDSLQEIANNTRMLAESKKQESDSYAKSLDNTTYNNISTVAATDTKTNTSEAPKKYTSYSETFRNSANQKDEQLATLRSNTGTPDNLKEQNILIEQYINDIETEVALKKKEQLATTDGGDKIKLAQQIKNLQTRKIELSNEKNTNDNILRFASGNNTVAVNTNTTTTNNTAVSSNTVVASTTTNTLAATNNTSKTNSTTDVKANGFEVKNANAYSNARPIPLDEKMPEGLMFRVQIGAFNNPIQPERFAGLAPVGAESTKFGFIRYQVGMFNEFQKANAVKNDLRKLKYSDAFVVAYLNGKRIPLSEALNSLAKQGGDITPNANSTAGITVNSNIPVNPEPRMDNGIPVNTSGDLNTFNGVFYTVQIGVYGNTIRPGGLRNLSPIFKEALPTGYYRYTAGIYSNFEKVKADRAKVVSLGITDAFIGGYLNGKRVSVNEAVNAENPQFRAEQPIIFGGTANAVAANTQTVNNQPASNVQPFSNGVTQAPAPTAENGVKATEDGVTFKVQIGAYKRQVPQAVADNWLKVKTWPVKYITINDLYLYTIGSFTERKFAKQLRDEVIGLGLTDAFVVVYKDGKKLYGAEAAQYLTR